MNQNIKLQNCPFCGGYNVKLDPGNIDDKVPAYVFCRDCVAVGPSAELAWEASLRWNRRDEVGEKMEHLLNIRQVSKILGLSRSTIYRLMQNGNFPSPIQPKGTKLNRWPLAVVEAYKDESIEARPIGKEFQAIDFN